MIGGASRAAPLPTGTYTGAYALTTRRFDKESPMLGKLMIPALALVLAATPALADGKKGHKKHKEAYHGGQSFCPPGLAKKNPPCVPPGLARQERAEDRHDDHHHFYRVGDYIHRDYVVLRDPLTYGLDPRGTYWRVGDNLFRVDGQSGRVLATLGLLSALLN
jgi:hypothetical protein